MIPKAQKCSQVGTAYDPDQQCGAWANHQLDGKPYCRHHPASARPPRKPGTLLEDIVWDALKNSRCPASHRYQGPSTSLPCRWCRTAHAVMLVLGRMKQGKDIEEIVREFEQQLGWTLGSPVVGARIPYATKESD